MIRQFPVPALIAGAVSAALLALMHHGIVQGLMIVPLLPLAAMAWSAFSFGIIGLSATTLTAVALGIVLLGPFEMAVILMLQLFPAWLFIRELLKLRLYRQGHVQWMPPSGAFLALTFYAASLLSLLFFMLPEAFDQVLSQLGTAWQEALRALDPATEAALDTDVNMSHLALALAVWVAGGMFYAAACFGNFAVLAYRRSLRSSLALEPYLPPPLLFGLFLLSALGASIGEGRWQLLGQMLSLIFLLPYFIAGLSFVHAALRRWQHPVIWQVAFYSLLAVTLWPAMFLAAYGLTRQCLNFVRAAPQLR